MGIKGITQSREEEKQDRQNSGNLELWLKDGGQAYVAFAATGGDDDHRLDDLWVHTQNFRRDDGSTGFKNVLCKKTFGEQCDDKKGHEFAIWAYVYYILHLKQEDGSWEPQKSASGITRYKQVVNEFRIYRKGFGKGDYLWNQLVGIFEDSGALDKMVCRISRRGSGMKDTSYAISVVSKEAKLPAEAVEKRKELTPIKVVYKEKLGLEGEEKPQVTEKGKPSSKILEEDFGDGDDAPASVEEVKNGATADTEDFAEDLF